MQKKKLKTILLRTLATFISLLIVLILAEIVLRESMTHVREQNLKGGFTLETTPEKLIHYTGKGRRLVPNADVVVHNHYLSGYDVPVSTNSYGFRHSQIDPQKAADEIRILVLGDSITIAEYLPYDLTYVAQIRNVLSAKIKEQNVSVINAGVMDIGIREYVDILEESGLKVQPDLVILGFYLNDARPSWGFSSENRHRGWLRRHSLLAETIWHQVKLQQWIKETGADRFSWIPAIDTLEWMTDKEAFNELVSLARYDWGAGWVNDDWQIVEAELKRVRGLSDQFGFPVLVTIFPVTFQVTSDVADDQPQQHMSELARKYNFHFLDLLPSLQKYQKENPDTQLFYDQCHPTAESSEIIGEAIAEKIYRERLFSPEKVTE